MKYPASLLLGGENDSLNRGLTKSGEFSYLPHLDYYLILNMIIYNYGIVTFLFARPKRKVTKRKRAPKSKRNDGFPIPPPIASRGALGATGSKTHTIVSNAQSRRFWFLKMKLFQFQKILFWTRMKWDTNSSRI